MTSLTKIGTFPETLSYIDNNVFVSSMAKIRTLKVAPNNPVYDSRNDCNAIIETKTNTLIRGCNSTIIPNTVTTIGMNALAQLTFTSINIPESVTEIEEDAFLGCNRLSSVTLPSGLIALNQGVFYNCTQLTLVEFSSNLVEFGYSCFGNDNNLNVINYQGTLAQFALIADSIKGSNNFEQARIDVFCTDGQTAILNSVGNMLITYSDGSQVEIPVGRTVYAIDYNNFPSEQDYGIQNLQDIVSIVIPEGVDTLDENAFNFRRVSTPINITTIILPSSLSRMASKAFRSCTTLTSIGNNNVLSAYMGGDSNFRGCSSLGHITLPSGMDYIPEYTFADCGTLSLTLKYQGVVYSEYSNIFDNTTLTHIYVHPDYVQAYKESEFWAQYASIIEADPTVPVITSVSLFDANKNYYYFTKQGDDFYTCNDVDLNSSFSLEFVFSDGQHQIGVPNTLFFDGWTIPDPQLHFFYLPAEEGMYSRYETDMGSIVSVNLSVYNSEEIYNNNYEAMQVVLLEQHE